MNESRRHRIIDAVIKDLTNHRNGGPDAQAVDENIDFFNAIRNPLRYAVWLCRNVGRMRKSRHSIRELADLGLSHWGMETYRQLVELERRPFPGLLQPLIERIVREIAHISTHTDEPIQIVSVGAGGMEVERQVVAELQNMGVANGIQLVALELVEQLAILGTQNVAAVANGRTSIERAPDIRQAIGQRIDREAIRVGIVVGDALRLLEAADAPRVDLIYHSRFKHHLDVAERPRFDEVIQRKARVVLEYDDYFFPPVLVFPSIIGWQQPLLLNGAILSYLRDPSKREAEGLRKEGWGVRTFFLGYYLAEKRSP